MNTNFWICQWNNNITQQSPLIGGNQTIEPLHTHFLFTHHKWINKHHLGLEASIFADGEFILHLSKCPYEWLTSRNNFLQILSSDFRIRIQEIMMLIKDGLKQYRIDRCETTGLSLAPKAKATNRSVSSPMNASFSSSSSWFQTTSSYYS